LFIVSKSVQLSYLLVRITGFKEVKSVHKYIQFVVFSIS